MASIRCVIRIEREQSVNKVDFFFVLTYSLGKHAKIWNTPNEELVEVKLVCGLRRFITEVFRCLCVSAVSFNEQHGSWRKLRAVSTRKKNQITKCFCCGRV